MEHVRTRALKAARAILEGIPRVKSVSIGHRYPFGEDDLPVIRLAWVDETISREAGQRGQRVLTRQMTLQALLVDSAPETTDDEPLEYGLDAIQAEVESRLAANVFLRDADGQRTVRDVRPATTATGVNARGAQAVVVTAALFTVLATHREGDPQTPYDQPGA